VEEFGRTLLGRLANLDLADVEPIRVLTMRCEPPRQLHPLTKLLPPVTLESRRTERQARLDDLGVRSLAESVRDDGLVLFRHDGAGRVDDVASRRGVGRDRVDGAEDELLLEVREEGKVALRLEGIVRQSSGREREENGKLTLLTLTD
jgi:hypothetical protein